jgi:hypothetical protein
VKQFLTAGIALLAAATSAEATMLYNGAAGTAPESQGHLTYQSNPIGGATKTTSAGKTTIDTTSNLATQAGFANYSVFGTAVSAAGTAALDRSTGYKVIFDARVISESHTGTNGPNRAGLSLTIVGSDLRGIELGFWTDQVWAQEGGTTSLFTKAESANFDTTVAVTRYEVSVQGNNYSVTANGNPLLSGPLRDYTAFPNPTFPIADPYELPNYLAVSDNTTSASGAWEFAYLETVVPEPATASLLLLGASALLGRRRHRA